MPEATFGAGSTTGFDAASVAEARVASAARLGCGLASASDVNGAGDSDGTAGRASSPPPLSDRNGLASKGGLAPEDAGPERTLPEDPADDNGGGATAVSAWWLAGLTDQSGGLAVAGRGSGEGGHLGGLAGDGLGRWFFRHVGRQFHRFASQQWFLLSAPPSA